MEKELMKMGYYTIYQVTTKDKIKYKVDSGKTLYIARFKKYVVNPYRDVKEFTSLEKAKEYVGLRLVKKSQDFDYTIVINKMTNKTILMMRFLIIFCGDFFKIILLKNFIIIELEII